MHFWYCDDIRNESDLEFDPSKKTITLLLVDNGTLITTFGILVLEGKNLMQQAIHLYHQLIMIYTT